MPLAGLALPVPNQPVGANGGAALVVRTGPRFALETRGSRKAPGPPAPGAPLGKCSLSYMGSRAGLCVGCHCPLLVSLGAGHHLQAAGQGRADPDPGDAAGGPPGVLAGPCTLQSFEGGPHARACPLCDPGSVFLVTNRRGFWLSPAAPRPVPGLH